MITVTATHAARNFANLLDAVEHGETVVVTRDGVPVARFTPEQRTSADQLKAALREHPADSGFADDLLATHRHTVLIQRRGARVARRPEWQPH